MMKLLITKQPIVFCRFTAAAQNLYHSFNEEIISFVRVINFSSSKDCLQLVRFFLHFLLCLLFLPLTLILFFCVSMKGISICWQTLNTYLYKNIITFLISKFVFQCLQKYFHFFFTPRAGSKGRSTFYFSLNYC